MLVVYNKPISDPSERGAASPCGFVAGRSWSQVLVSRHSRTCVARFRSLVFKLPIDLGTFINQLFVKRCFNANHQMNDQRIKLKRP